MKDKATKANSREYLLCLCGFFFGRGKYENKRRRAALPGQGHGCPFPVTANVSTVFLLYQG